MSTKSDPSQGIVPDPARPRGHSVPNPDNAAQFQQIQAAVNAADRAAMKPRPPQEVADRQDWRKG